MIEAVLLYAVAGAQYKYWWKMHIPSHFVEQGSCKGDMS